MWKRCGCLLSKRDKVGFAATKQANVTWLDCSSKGGCLGRRSRILTVDLDGVLAVQRDGGVATIVPRKKGGVGVR